MECKLGAPLALGLSVNMLLLGGFIVMLPKALGITSFLSSSAVYEGYALPFFALAL
jgi:hypothetical protein